MSALFQYRSHINMPDPAYVLGHGANEVRRLELQSRLLAPGTERTLRAAGLAPGMSVLDVGTGAGDVAMLAAEMVGPSGSVLGIDREASVLERARERAEAAGLACVRYEAATIDALPKDQTFDAVLGRYVLLFQPDRAAFLRQAATRVRPGGTLVMMEPGAPELEGSDPTCPERWSHPPVALFDEVRDLILTAFRLAGARVHTGTGLVPLFGEAGLPEPTLLQDVPTGGARSPIAELTCLLFESLLPVLERHAVTTPAKIGLETLSARVQAAADEAHSQLRFFGLVGAWATLR
jgi:SAM-dependent methyltransferase